jgi:hypothetical protein
MRPLFLFLRRKYLINLKPKIVNMISKIKIGNFKSIKDLELELAPLTIFVGPNASGKSNVLESIAVLAQTASLDQRITRSLEGSLGYGAFIRYPISRDFPLSDFVAYKRDGSKFITFEIHTRDEENHDIGYSYAFMPKDREVRQAVFTTGKKLVEVGYLRAGESSWRREFLYPEDLKQSIQPADNTEYILDPICFNYVLKSPITDQEKKHIEESILQAKKLVKMIEAAVRNIYFISAIRGEVRPFVETGVGESRLGTHGEGLIEILSMIFGKSEYEEMSKKIIKWASEFVMEAIKAGLWGRNLLSSDYIDPELRTHLNTALASQGSRQILTIITQLFWSPPGSVIMIEEPEISLHIESQLHQLLHPFIQRTKKISAF